MGGLNIYMQPENRIKTVPKPYKNTGLIKVFVLGSDPTAKDGKSDNLVREIEYIFDLGGKDKRYFAGIMRNMKSIGLELINGGFNSLSPSLNLDI